MGMPAIDAARAVVKEYKLPISPEQFYAVFQANVAKFLTSCPLLPGVRDLVLHLHEHRIPFCIATSSYRDIYELKAAFHKDIILAFHHVVCGNDPEIKPGRGKPMPDIFLLAASRFNPPADPKKCLVFEDSPNGLRAGVAAGMQTVFIPADHIKKDLMKGATLVLKSMAQFKPQLFGLPAFGNCSKFEFG